MDPPFFYTQIQRQMSNKKKSPGRPPRAGRASNKVIHIRATEAERDHFNELAREHGMTGSEYLRSLIPSEVFEPKKDDSHVFYPNDDRLLWQFNVRLSTDDTSMLDQIAEEYNMKKSDVVRQLIRHQHQSMKNSK